MFKIIHGLFLLLLLDGWAELIVYTPEEMERYKKECKEAMASSLINQRDPSYQMLRALRTVSGDDADYIPKIPGAGEIFKDEVFGPYQLMHNGVKIILNSYYDSQWLTDVIHGLKGHHEPQEEKCFYEIIKFMPDDATMIELGAYWAYYSLWFASEVKGAKNYLIEPDPKRLAIGQRNFELNDKKGVFQRGYAGIILDEDPDIDGAECIAIDDFIECKNIEHVNILHADIQGAEYTMLLSCIKSLDKIDYFIISTHKHEEDHLPCLQFFKTHGFIILAEHTGAESCSGDGLIVARRNNVLGAGIISIKRY